MKHKRSFKIILFGMSTCMMLIGFISTNTLSAQTSDNSGFIHTAVPGVEEFNLLKIKFENDLVGDQSFLVKAELNKYPGLQSLEFEGSQYMVIKFNHEINANQILAVLEKINHPGHYLNSGSPVYYVKDETIYFIR